MHEVSLAHTPGTKFAVKRVDWSTHEQRQTVAKVGGGSVGGSSAVSRQACSHVRNHQQSAASWRNNSGLNGPLQQQTADAAVCYEHAAPIRALI